MDTNRLDRREGERERGGGGMRGRGGGRGRRGEGEEEGGNGKREGGGGGGGEREREGGRRDLADELSFEQCETEYHWPKSNVTKWPRALIGQASNTNSNVLSWLLNQRGPLCN